MVSIRSISHNYAAEFIVAPSSDECENYVVHLKEQSVMKKRYKSR